MNREEYIAELSERLRNLHAADPESQLGAAFLRWIEDPLKPRTDRGSIHPNRLPVLLAALAVLAGGTFLFFTLVQL